MRDCSDMMMSSGSRSSSESEASVSETLTRGESLNGASRLKVNDTFKREHTQKTEP